MDSLRAGDRLQTEFSGADCVVESFVGEGGQGSVYFVTLGDLRLALKLYFERWLSIDRTLRRRLEEMISAGTPSDNYIWPIDIAEGGSRYGYVMPRVPPDFHDLNALVSGRLQPTFRAVLSAGFDLANSFRELHARGLSYQDISPSNVFMHESGAIRICDCDNVSVNNVPSAIGGTPGFMAPEIGLGTSSPNSDTDLFSLAVLLFEMLVLQHPLLGKHELDYPCWKPGVTDVELFYKHPVFIFDPRDDSNRALPGHHDRAIAYWALYPQYLKDLFIASFTDGLRDPRSRVLESTWRKALVRLRDAIALCPSCGAENFDDAAASGLVCWNCHRPFECPVLLRVCGNLVVLNTETKLYPHHVDPQRLYDFSRPVATVRPHPTLPNVFGLRNDSAAVWKVRAPGGGEPQPVPAGRVTPLQAGATIDFGTSAGTLIR